jgi:hypothetical protein
MPSLSDETDPAHHPKRRRPARQDDSFARGGLIIITTSHIRVSARLPPASLQTCKGTLRLSKAQGSAARHLAPPPHLEQNNQRTLLINATTFGRDQDPLSDLANRCRHVWLVDNWGSRICRLFVLPSFVLHSLFFTLSFEERLLKFENRDMIAHRQWNRIDAVERLDQRRADRRIINA